MDTINRRPGSGILLMDKPVQGGVTLYKGPLTMLDGREFVVKATASKANGYDVEVLDTKGWTKKAEFKLASFVTRPQQRVNVDLVGHIVARAGKTNAGRVCVYLNIFENRPEYLV